MDILDSTLYNIYVEDSVTQGSSFGSEDVLTTEMEHPG